ncbi:hypothetical protein KAF25_008274 [Fusarium avenaceum]|uniref:Uncharacterized protein n=1 Tax=Fusarium avenaceum TaxID=40199 RepID=A0A9P7HF42_9HYPO|nr:hypothetical protein KAF25_008274 [Fusarium avenaceum]
MPFIVYLTYSYYKMKTALPLMALASLAVASNTNLGIFTSPNKMSIEEWQSRFKNPNATGTYAFEGYNVSEPSPANKTVDGWTATIRVANITDDPDADQPYPGIDISVKAPDGMKLPELNSSQTNSSNWHVCMSFWTISRMEDRTTDDAQDDDGDCSSFLSEECIEALKDAGIGHSWNGRRCGNAPRLPRECGDYYINTSRLPETGSLGANLSLFDGSTLISQQVHTNEGQVGMSQKDAYNGAVRGVWTVMIGWGRQSKLVYSKDDVMQPTLLCLRARNITNGSEDPNAGVRATVHGPVVLFISLLVLALLV